MALMTWRKRDPKGQPTGPTLYLDFDATLLEEFSRSAEVTRFPVEDGSVLSDHYQPQPRAITLEVQVTDTPVRPRKRIDGKTSAINEPIGIERPLYLDLPLNPAPVTGVTGPRIIRGNVERFPKQRTVPILQFDGEVYRTVDAFLMLDELMQTGQLVDILLFREVEYTDMVIVNVNAPRDADSGSTLTFTIDLVQVVFASTETGASPQPKEKKHSPRQDAGGRNPTGASATGSALAEKHGYT